MTDPLTRPNTALEGRDRVMRELGLSLLVLVEKTYRHLLNVRHWSPVLEYREAEVLPFRKTADGA
jgi:hypothetical protein